MHTLKIWAKNKEENPNYTMKLILDDLIYKYLVK